MFYSGRSQNKAARWQTAGKIHVQDEYLWKTAQRRRREGKHRTGIQEEDQHKPLL